MTKEPIGYAYYLGKKYPIYVKLEKQLAKSKMKFDHEAFICEAPDLEGLDITKPLQSFYRKTARKLIANRLKFYGQQFKVKYKSFQIESVDGRWGSCNSKKELTFNWKLILFPMEAVDYVVVHEMCHLLHMNHDRSFWRLVGKVYPEYKEAMKLIGSSKQR